MIRLFQFLLLVLLLPFTLQAQQEDEMETDLPSESQTPFVVPKNRLLIEVGFRKENDKAEGIKHTEYLYPTAWLKYGLSKKIELRLIIENQIDYDYDPGKHTAAKGLQPLKAGFKYNLFDEKGILPQTSVIAMASIPKAASNDFKGEFVAPMIRLAMENKLSEKFALVYNIGEQWEDDDVHGEFLYSVCPEYDITNKLTFYAEAFGKISKENPAENNFNAEFFYQLKPNFQIDLFGGFALSERSPDNFVELGFAWRLPK